MIAIMGVIGQLDTIRSDIVIAYGKLCGKSEESTGLIQNLRRDLLRGVGNQSMRSIVENEAYCTVAAEHIWKEFERAWNVVEKHLTNDNTKR